MKGAIIDLDGTLLDSMGIWDDLGERFLRTKGFVPKPDLNERIKCMSLVQSAQYFQSEYGLTDSEEMIIKGIGALAEEQYRNSIPLKRGAEAFVRKLKRDHVLMCIATATHRDLAEAALFRLGIADCFCGILSCGEAGMGKDDPEFFVKALALLQTQKCETIVFEDALHAIKTAKSAGFYVAAIYDKSADADEAEIRAIADRYLNSFEEWEIEERCKKY